MKKYFAQLRPLERRLAVGVLVVVIVVLNAWLIWPHFSDWGNLSRRLNDARSKLTKYETAVAQLPALEKEMKTFEGQGESVAPEDQAINFIRAIQSQAAESGVGISSTSRQLSRTNEFFIEQVQNITVTATDEQLVDFLFKLGSGASMIRVRDLELQADNAHQRLNANIRLVASYQKKPAAKPAATAAATPAAAKLLTKTVK
jgi:Tfp pilus assembly protein PilO